MARSRLIYRLGDTLSKYTRYARLGTCLAVKYILSDSPEHTQEINREFSLRLEPTEALIPKISRISRGMRESWRRYLKKWKFFEAIDKDGFYWTKEHAHGYLIIRDRETDYYMGKYTEDGFDPIRGDAPIDMSDRVEKIIDIGIRCNALKSIFK